MKKMRKPAFVWLWALATLTVTGLTWRVVAAAQAQVTDRPLAPIVALPPATTSTSVSTSVALDPVVSTTRPQTSHATGAPDNTTTSAVTGTDPSATQPDSSKPPVTTPGSSTAPPPTTTTTFAATTTTTAPAGWSTQTISTAGGTVIVEYRPGEVRMRTATPAIGYAIDPGYEVGPPKVEVKFVGPTRTIKVEVRWKDGKLSPKIDDESND